jgi:multidrug efflux pump subunit AcrA (membrane-fusion protein)
MSRNIIFRNFGWKLLSLALAIIIWLTIKALSAEQGQTERMFVNLPIQIVSGTADVRTFRVEPNLVNVTVKGRPGAISRLTEREIRVLVDATSADVTQSFRRHLDVAVPNGITIVRFEPIEVQITPPPKPEPKIIISAPKTNP